MTVDLHLDLPGGGYPILVRHDALAEGAARIAEQVKASNTLVISDENVWRIHGPRFQAALEAQGVRSLIRVVPAGEASKSLPVVSGLYDAALDAGLDRDAVVVAFGGGVVGDLAGFVAATLLRGLRFIQVPTTLLAQVDSSVGGKVGVNHARGKNLIGAFHQPVLVFADTAWLGTLAPRSLRAGLAEVIKHGLVARPALLDAAPAALAAWQAGRHGALVDVVAQAITVKAEVVAGDVHEAGDRALLNLGHTLGHAIEAAHPGVLEHGEAVALGIAAAAERSLARGFVTLAECRQVVATLKACGLDTAWRAWISPAVLDKVANDKKIRGEYVNDVLLRGLGRCQIDPVTLEAWRRTVVGLAAHPVEA
ncbi:MAG: 3-dehydroquinate synthase [bacterium]